MAITRRRLLATGASVTAAVSLADVAAALSLTDVTTAQATLTFYDPRFPQSRQLASALPEALRLDAIPGDPSRLLAHIRSTRTQGRGLRVQGVTTESVPFCLEQFAFGDPDLCLQSRRLDRDLFVWSLTNGAP